jgi:hypothetical protein
MVVTTALLHAGRGLALQGSLPGPFGVFWPNTGEVLAVLRGSLDDLDSILSAPGTVCRMADATSTGMSGTA